MKTSDTQAAQASQSSHESGGGIGGAVRAVVAESRGTIGAFLEKGKSVAAHSKAVLDEAEKRQRQNWEAHNS